VPGRKVVGRVLSIGYPLPGPLVDNYGFFSAPSFFDYDAMVVDPASVAHVIAGVVDGSAPATTFTDAPVVNDALADASASLAAIIARRRDETAQLLANGGALVCIAHPETALRGVDGAGDIGSYAWLPAELPIGECLRPAEGSEADIVDYRHPLAAFVHRRLADVAYRASIELKSWPGFVERGGSAFVRSRGGAAIGVELPIDAPGRLVVLPTMKLATGDERYAVSDVLQAGIRLLLGAEAPGREPAWTSSFELPGLDERAQLLEAARAGRDAAETALEAAEDSYDEIGRFRRLLWQEGSAGLTATVIDAMRLIGIDVYAGDPNEIELRVDGTPLLLEVEASEQPIGMAPHYRLRERIERAIEQRGASPRGLIVVNGRRLAPPSQRADEVSAQLRLASETMRYCIAPASTLFAAVAAQLAGDAASVASFRARILAHDGLLGD
jgi:hypothetical protein